MTPRPHIPPSSQSYEPWLKSALQSRVLRFAFTTSAFACWVFAAFWTSWASTKSSGGIITEWLSKWFSPQCILFALLSWTLGSVPILATRKRSSAPTRSPASSPKHLFELQVRDVHAQRNLLLLTLSATVLVIAHLIVIKWSGVGGYWSMTVWAKARNHPYHLDGRYLYLLLTQGVLASTVWFSDILRERHRLRLRRSSCDTVSAVAQATASSVVSTAVLTVVSTVMSLVLFACLRGVLHPAMYALPVFRQLLRPFTAHFLKPKRTLTYLWSHFGLVMFAASENFTTGLIWDIPSSVFDVFSSHPIEVCANTPNPVSSMVSGITSADTYFQFHAFNELAGVAMSSTDAARDMRIKIYSDAKFRPTLWDTVLRHSLLILGRDYQTLLRRGQAVKAPAPVKVETSRKDRAPLAPAIRASIFKRPQPDPLSAIANAVSSEGAISTALASSSDSNTNVARLLDTVVSGSSSGFRSAFSSLLTTERKPNAPGNILVTGRAFNWIALQRNVRSLRSWWSRERKDRVCSNSLPNDVLDSMVIEMLCALIACALSEDAFGVVQKDVPKVLEAMLAFFTALQEYQTEFNATIEKLSKESQINQDDAIDLEEALKASEHLNGPITSLRNGLGSIVFTYGDRLRSFSFPSRTAIKLQEFIDSLNPCV